MFISRPRAVITNICRTAAAVLLCIATAVCADKPVIKSNTPDEVVDRIMAREKDNAKNFEKYAPMIETYLQMYTADKELGRTPASDQYFLGRASFKGRVSNETFLEQTDEKMGFTKKLIRKIMDIAPVRRTWEPTGFVQMAVIDTDGFDRQHYTFNFLKREFLGTVRCLVFDVIPREKSGAGRFLGRVYVEDRDYNIVRFNGVFVRPKDHTAYTHFDSWRINVQGNQWLPAYIYSEESGITLEGKKLAFKSQTRFWGYAASLHTSSEFTAVMVDSSVSDQTSDAGVLSPLAAERQWERQAEDNVIEKLEQNGLLAAPSEVDKVLETVTNNLIITNELTVEPEIRCRVLLTSPIESFTVGHTIVISRGLLDVLPDEASLAAVLAHELSHIVLAHQVDTQFAFGDRLLFNESDTLRRLSMAHTADEEADADKKSLELLAKSPYADKLQNIGLFLKQLQANHDSLPNLTRSRIGNAIIDSNGIRLGPVMSNAPELKKTDIKQTAALPLGARIELEPWSNQVQLTRARSVSAVNAREKLPLLVTPFYPFLQRVGEAEKQQAKPNPSEDQKKPPLDGQQRNMSEQ